MRLFWLAFLVALVAAPVRGKEERFVVESRATVATRYGALHITRSIDGPARLISVFLEKPCGLVQRVRFLDTNGDGTTDSVLYKLEDRAIVLYRGDALRSYWQRIDGGYVPSTPVAKDETGMVVRMGEMYRFTPRSSKRWEQRFTFGNTLLAAASVTAITAHAERILDILRHDVVPDPRVLQHRTDRIEPVLVGRARFVYALNVAGFILNGLSTS